MVNRATFYRHYLDKYELLDQYMNEVYELTAGQKKLFRECTPGRVWPNPAGLKPSLRRTGDASRDH